MNRLEWIVLIVSATYIAANVVSWIRDADDSPTHTRCNKRDTRERCLVEELE